VLFRRVTDGRRAISQACGTAAHLGMWVSCVPGGRHFPKIVVYRVASGEESSLAAIATPSWVSPQAL
jgi:hypothetical protein